MNGQDALDITLVLVGYTMYHCRRIDRVSPVHVNLLCLNAIWRYSEGRSSNEFN